MIEALANPNDQTHIRRPEKYNTSKHTLKTLKHAKKLAEDAADSNGANDGDTDNGGENISDQAAAQ